MKLNKKWIWVIIIYIIVIVLIYIYDYNKLVEKINVQQLNQCKPIGEIINTSKVVQSIASKQHNISSISLMFATYNRKNHGEIIFSVKESLNSKTDLVKKKIDISKMRDNTFYNIKFPMIHIEKGQVVYMCLEAPKCNNKNAVTIWYDSKKKYSTRLYINNKLVSGSLKYIVYSKIKKWQSSSE